MKKSEVITKIVEKVNSFHYSGAHTFMTHEGYWLAILDLLVDDIGMLPPVNTCKVISDGKGGYKHSPSIREWDEEAEYPISGAI